MSRLARVVVAGAPHHVKERGNRRQRTFFCDEDDKTYPRPGTSADPPPVPPQARSQTGRGEIRCVSPELLMGNSPEICRRHYAALLPTEMGATVEFLEKLTAAVDAWAMAR